MGSKVLSDVTREDHPKVYLPQEITSEMQNKKLNIAAKDKFKKVGPTDMNIKDELANLNSKINPNRERTLILEYQLLQKYSPVGIYCLPKEGSHMSQWHGVYLCKQGIYSDAIIKFRMDFPAQYPKVMPQVVFQSQIFHPLVDPATRQLKL